MSAIKLQKPLSINDVVRLIHTVGDRVTLLLLSEPGVGKTSVLTNLAVRNGDKWRGNGDNYPTDKERYVYVDVPNVRDGDLFMRMPDNVKRTLRQFLTDLIDPNDPRPVNIMFDELLKGPRSVRPLFTRALLEKALGDYTLPKGSRVFATSNNVSDGVGDSIEAHVANRVTIVPMRKPKVEEWCVWGEANGISPTTLACVAMNPRVMASYTDGADAANNEYIFNPRTNPVTFASPRSIAKADVLVRNSSMFGEDAVFTTIAGTCGLPYASLITTFIALQDQLIPPKQVIADPMGVTVPTGAALWLLMFNLIPVIETQDDLNAAVVFMQRVPSREIQAVFNTMCLNNERLLPIAQSNATIQTWMLTNKNYKLLMA
jgi:hypothetical protein